MSLADLELVETLFFAALELRPDERPGFMESSGAHPAVRQEVRTLLAGYQRRGLVDRFAEASGARTGASELAGTAAEPDLERGIRVGRYRVDRLIARGGMGAVYLAHRADGQVDYEVALKVLRADLHTPTWRRRFLDERQVLARTEHPGIARLLDAGTTPDGRPWFAMEHVDGRPIVDHCDEHSLETSERLELFRRVCDAVEHAHRHLVVHRDIKPDNVLVTAGGGVKLLDFGIAKVLASEEQPVAGRTAIGHRILTPDYAAPEQLRGDPITTSTDVFQLGLLLHVLLTGRLPGSRENGHRDGRPTLPGDLRAIVDEALAEDPGDRYATVEHLSDDVRRYRTGMPVRARAGRTGYHLVKFVRRHAIGVAAAATIAMLVATLAVASTVQAGRIATERDRAQQVSALLVELFESAAPAVARGEPPDALELLDQGVERVRTSPPDDPEVAATMFAVLSDVQYDLGRYTEAADLGWEAVHALTEAVGPDDLRTVDRMVRVASALGSAGLADSAGAVASEALTRAPWRSGAAGAIRGRALQARAFALQTQGSADASAQLLDSAIALYRSAPGDSARLQLASALVNQAWLHENAGRRVRAAALLEESVQIRTELLDPEHPSTLNSLSGLAEIRLRAGEVDAAEALARDALRRARRYYGDDGTRVGGALLSLARVLERRGDPDEAEARYREALAVLEEEAAMYRAPAYNDFGLFLLHERGLSAEAARQLRAAAAAYRSTRGPDDAWTAVALSNLADALIQAGASAEAAREARRAVDALEALGPEPSPYLPGALTTRGLALRALGRTAEADSALRRAISTARQLGDSVRVARAQAVLGLVLHDTGAPGATEMLSRSWRLLESSVAPHDPIRVRVEPVLAASGGSIR